MTYKLHIKPVLLVSLLIATALLGTPGKSEGLTAAEQLTNQITSRRAISAQDMIAFALFGMDTQRWLEIYGDSNLEDGLPKFELSTEEFSNLISPATRGLSTLTSSAVLFPSVKGHQGMPNDVSSIQVFSNEDQALKPPEIILAETKLTDIVRLQALQNKMLKRKRLSLIGVKNVRNLNEAIEKVSQRLLLEAFDILRTSPAILASGSSRANFLVYIGRDLNTAIRKSDFPYFLVEVEAYLETRFQKNRASLNRRLIDYSPSAIWDRCLQILDSSL